MNQEQDIATRKTEILEQLREYDRNQIFLQMTLPSAQSIFLKTYGKIMQEHQQRMSNIMSKMPLTLTMPSYLTEFANIMSKMQKDMERINSIYFKCFGQIQALSTEIAGKYLSLYTRLTSNTEIIFKISQEIEKKNSDTIGILYECQDSIISKHILELINDINLDITVEEYSDLFKNDVKQYNPRPNVPFEFVLMVLQKLDRIIDYLKELKDQGKAPFLNIDRIISIFSLMATLYFGFVSTMPPEMYLLKQQESEERIIAEQQKTIIEQQKLMIDFQKQLNHQQKEIDSIKKNIYKKPADDFKKIPGNPFAYWISSQELAVYTNGLQLKDYAVPKQGLATGDNERFLRFWYELSFYKIGFSAKNGKTNTHKWYPCNKGGSFRRWYGNAVFVVNWENDGYEIKHNFDSKGKLRSRPQNSNYYFREGMSWSTLATEKLGMRYSPAGWLFETKGSVCFPLKKSSLFYALGFANCKIVERLLLTLSPTLDFHEGPVGKLPFIEFQKDIIESYSKACVAISRTDWDSFETSWDFQGSPLLSHRVNESVEESYNHLRAFWKEQTEEMRRLEIDNNRLFIEAYGLQDELSPEVPWNEITLLCNPWYRYKGEKEPNDQTNSQNSDTLPYSEELEAKLLEDTMKDFLSYAVGCMMGRYSLNHPGLAIADQVKWEPGKTNIPDWILESEDPNPSAVTTSFPIDQRGIVPFLDDDWFANDVTERFKVFLKVTFGEENFLENLKFIEKALGKSVRKYFTKDFYKDHLRRYKNRPIYWMFSSSKGTFNVLVYMHRCTRHTGDWILNEYLRDFILKLRTHRDYLAQENSREDLSTSDKTRNFKQIAKYSAMLSELEEYESNVMYPIALEKIEFDLDDGVKVNYAKYGKALRKIPGLDAKEE